MVPSAPFAPTHLDDHTALHSAMEFATRAPFLISSSTTPVLPPSSARCNGVLFQSRHLSRGVAPLYCYDHSVQQCIAIPVASDGGTFLEKKLHCLGITTPGGRMQWSISILTNSFN